VNGRAPAKLSMSPSDYFRSQVRVSAFAYEDPAFLREQLGADLFMCGSDYPHAIGSIALMKESIAAAGFSAAERTLMHGETAARVYGLVAGVAARNRAV